MMDKHNKFWTERRLRIATSALGECISLREAAALLKSKGAPWHRITAGKISDGFRRYAEHGAAHYLAEPSKPPTLHYDEQGQPTPAPASLDATPTPAPLDVARAKAVSQASESRDRQALKAALARIDTLEGQLATMTAGTSAPLAPVQRVELARGARQACAVALLSDVHAGANVRETPSTFGNRYNRAIAEYRVGRFFAGVEWLVQAYRDGASAYAWEIRDLVLWFGGDLIDNQLHDDQRETSEPPIKSIDWLEPLLVDGVRRLRAADLNVRLVCSWGNHGRDTIKMRAETGAEHSHEWGMYQRIARELRGEVPVLADASAHQYVDVYDRTLHFHHGHDVRYAGGVGGIAIPMGKAVPAWNEVRRAHLHHVGHFHQQVAHGNWFANGSVVGYNAYAMSIKAKPEAPQQTFYLLDAKRGVTAVSPVWVSDAKVEASL